MRGGLSRVLLGSFTGVVIALDRTVMLATQACAGARRRRQATLSRRPSASSKAPDRMPRQVAAIHLDPGLLAQLLEVMVHGCTAVWIVLPYQHTRLLSAYLS